jgi:hypothetical protein
MVKRGDLPKAVVAADPTIAALLSEALVAAVAPEVVAAVAAQAVRLVGPASESCPSNPS